MKKKLLITALSAFTVACLSSCGSSFNAETDWSNGYNKNFWFKNDLEVSVADPSIIFHDGYYYMYGTTSQMGAAGFYCYKSKNLNYWDCLGPCFVPDVNAWSVAGLWAPDVVEYEGKFYMYYTGSNYHFTKTGVKGLSVAVADNPAGPFKEYTGFDLYGNYFTSAQQLFDFGFATIDSSIFFDGNDMYMYFVQDQKNSVSTTYGVRMLNPVTPDYTSVTRLTTPGYSTLARFDDGQAPDVIWEKGSSSGKWNEAPTMIKVGSKYVLTYSGNPYWSVSYGVGFAVSDSPLGVFTKPNSYNNENLLLGVDAIEQGSPWDFMSGTGHHCFFYAGDELMIGYHAHTDRVYGSSDRAFAFDRVIEEGDGRLHANGPSWSLMHLPESVSGYKNVSKGATVSIDGDESVITKLNDEIIPIHMYQDPEVAKQEFFESGSHSVTLDLGKEYEVYAVAVYDSLDYETAVWSLNNLKVGSFEAKSISLNPAYINEEEQYLRPGSAFVAEFNPSRTSQISFSVSADHEFALSEVVVLAKEVA